MYTYTFYIGIHKYIHLYLYTYSCISECLRPLAHTQRYIYICTHIHKYIHAYMYKQLTALPNTYNMKSMYMYSNIHIFSISESVQLYLSKYPFICLSFYLSLSLLSIYLSAYINMYTHVCVYMYSYIYIHTRTGICIHIFVHACIYIYK